MGTCELIHLHFHPSPSPPCYVYILFKKYKFNTNIIFLCFLFCYKICSFKVSGPLVVAENMVSLACVLYSFFSLSLPFQNLAVTLIHVICLVFSNQLLERSCHVRVDACRSPKTCRRNY